MLKKYFTVLLFTLKAISKSNEQLADGKCVPEPVLKNFELEKAMGTWYAQDIASDKEISKKCLSYTLTSDKHKNNTVINIVRTYGPDKKTENFKMEQLNNTPEFRLEWFGNIRMSKLLDTDYKSWSLWYTCFPESHDKSLVAIVTREQKRKDALIKKGEEALKRLNLNSFRPFMKPIDNNNC